jgi:[protein-PII] uridylyltransferase
MSSKHEHISTKLQQKIDALITRFLDGKEPDFLKRHTQAIDDYFHESFETSIIGPHMGINKNPYAIIALGGYGRREQCIHSDVDLLFLFEKRVPQKSEQLIQEIITPFGISDWMSVMPSGR